MGLVVDADIVDMKDVCVIGAIIKVVECCVVDVIDVGCVVVVVLDTAIIDKKYQCIGMTLVRIKLVQQLFITKGEIVLPFSVVESDMDGE